LYFSRCRDFGEATASWAGDGLGVEQLVFLHLVGERYREFIDPVLFSQGFRPFFLGAGVWAVLAVAIWLLIVRGDTSLPTIFAPSRWHAHEMLFGFAAAVMASFVLTAIPNWTGRLPLQGLPLIVLSSTWLLGRVAMATSALIGGLLAAFIDLSFLAMLFSVVLREIVAGRNWLHFPLPVAVAHGEGRKLQCYLGCICLCARTSSRGHHDGKARHEQLFVCESGALDRNG
jgi:NnrS protein